MKRPDLLKRRTLFIDAMQELIKRYEMAIKNNTSKARIETENKWSCLLCDPSKKYGIDALARKADKYIPLRQKCEMIGCPWMVMEGMCCDDYYEAKRANESVYCSHDKRRIKRRIAQLERWIKIYEEAT